MSLETVQDLFVQELKDLYSAENQLIKALPKMVKAASNETLRQASAQHLEETKQQARRIEEIFQTESLPGSPRGHKCKGMEGLIEEGAEMLQEDGAANVLDAGLIGAAQRVEHYEMAGYGTAKALAKQLGLTGAEHLLQQSLDEESAADEKLTQIAESEIYVAQADGEMAEQNA